MLPVGHVSTAYTHGSNSVTLKQIPGLYRTSENVFQDFSATQQCLNETISSYSSYYIIGNCQSFSGKNSKMASRPAMSVGMYIA